MKYRQKIDKAASDQLERILRSFPAAWGELQKQNERYVFGGSADSVSIAVEYDAKKQLLGGVYSLVFSSVCGPLEVSEDISAELHYRGRLFKGDAYFMSGKKESPLSVMLNENKELITLLSQLDLVSMSVTVREGMLEMALSPLGGAFTYTVFPPMKYGALLPDLDIERIRTVFTKIAALSAELYKKRAAGAEL